MVILVHALSQRDRRMLESHVCVYIYNGTAVSIVLMHGETNSGFHSVNWGWIITMISLAHEISYKNVNLPFRGEWQTLSVQWKEHLIISFHIYTYI